MSVDIITADAVKWAEEYDGPLFHSLFCDAPYHLTTITKRFGKDGSAPAKFGKDGAFARASKGFMQMTWDGGDLAFQPETWYAFGKVLYPGAFGIAYASSRGYHRMAVAIEDAGFIIHPMIGWVQSQGFPKATRIDVKVEDADLARAWVGHRYGLQALAPSLEPICVFQKPYEGRPLDNITQTGAGALNIDAARIPSAEPYKINTWDDDAHPFGDGAGNPYTSRQETHGRWPKNLILDEAAAEALDRQSGNSSTKRCEKPSECDEEANTWGGTFQRNRGERGYTDEGGASRFFFNVQEQIDEADPINLYSCCPICSRRYGIISVTQEDKLCQPVNIVEKSLERKEQIADSAQDNALLSMKRDNEGNSESSPIPVNNVENNGKTTIATEESIVAENAIQNREKQLAQTVKSAGNLCDACAIAIAQNLVLISQDPKRELHLTLDYITEYKNRILNLSLALSVASQENTDIIQIIQSPMILSGFVIDVIENYTANIKQEQKPLKFHDHVRIQIMDSEPVRYQPKVSPRERNAGLDEKNTHACLKPLDLDTYLCRLLLPPSIYAPRRIFNPFAGVMSEAIGAGLAGWEEVVAVEWLEEYAEIGRKRVAYWMGKPRQISMLER